MQTRGYENTIAHLYLGFLSSWLVVQVMVLHHSTKKYSFAVQQPLIETWTALKKLYHLKYQIVYIPVYFVFRKYVERDPLNKLVLFRICHYICFIRYRGTQLDRVVHELCIPVV